MIATNKPAMPAVVVICPACVSALDVAHSGTGSLLQVFGTVIKRLLLLTFSLLVACAGPIPKYPAGTSCEASTFSVVDGFAGARRGTCEVPGENHVRLTILPEDAGVINDSPWFAFKIVAPKSTAARITLRYVGGHHRYIPKVSTDASHWTAIDADSVTVSADGLSATFELALSAGTTWVAGQELLLPTMYYAWNRKMAETTDASLAVLGLSLQDLPIDALRSNEGSNEVLFLVGRQHPPEVSGAIAFMSFFETLQADTEIATRFRERFQIIAIPLLNPDGVMAGNWRHNLGGTDLNRDWGFFVQPETQLIRDLLAELDANDKSIRVFLDFHSTQRNLLYTQDEDNETAPPRFTRHWLERVAARMPDYVFANEERPTDKPGVAKNYMYHRYGIPASSFEVGDETDRDITKDAARVFAEELMRMMLDEDFSESPANGPWDVLVVNGMVYDGSLAAGRITNIAIRGDRIVSVDADPALGAARVVDAHGMIVVPGFIDPHTHALGGLSAMETRANLNYLHQGVTTVVVGNDGAGVPDREGRLAKLEQQGTGTNVAFFAGHNQVRRAVMGMRNEHADADEIAAMSALLEDDMKAGAVGLSTGLFYAPGSYSGTDEVVALATVAAQYGGIYDTHLRSESSHAAGLLAAIDEAITVAREGNVPVHVSHIKALGRDSWGKSTEVVAMIENAQASGLDITANQYPWLASGTRFSSALIPRWVMADSHEKMIERLDDPELGQGIRLEMQRNLELRGGPDAMLVTRASSPYAGMTLTQIATELGQDPLEAAIRVVLDGDPSIASFVMSQDDVDRLAVQPWVMTGSDGSTGHPRLYGTYPKAWQDLVASRPLLSAEQFVHRSSGLVADTLGLCDRGYIREGYFADLAIIDPQRFVPRATYKDPTALSAGVSLVIVNGMAALDSGSVSTLPGRVLRKSAGPCMNERR